MTVTKGEENTLFTHHTANKSLDALKISHIFYFISLYIFRPDNKIVLYKLLYICVYTIMTGVRIFIEDGSGA
jgi:hypothetical protein